MPALDLNRDGEIRFQEAAQYSDAEMCFCEDQRACHAALGSFAPDLVLARTTGDKTSPRVGEHCEAESHGIWMKAKIMRSQGRQVPRRLGRSPQETGRLADSRNSCASTSRPVMEVGQRVQIEWGGVWYKGQILQVQGGLHLVHYEGFPSEDDEWTPLRRLRPQP